MANNTDPQSISPPARELGESAKAFDFFIEFIRMGPRRSLADLARRHHKTLQCFSFHARRWNWWARAAKYDDDIRAADERLLHQERERAERLRLRRVLEAREICWRLSVELLSAVERALIDAEEADNWSATDIARVAVVVDRLMRSAVEPIQSADAASAAPTVQLIAGAFRLYPDALTEPIAAGEPDQRAGRVATQLPSRADVAVESRRP